jgi:hypothetical protein
MKERVSFGTNLSRDKESLEEVAQGVLKTPNMLSTERSLAHKSRDGNSGTGTRPDGYEYGNNFLPVSDIGTRPELRRVCDGYFFHPRVTREVPDTLLPL